MRKGSEKSLAEGVLVVTVVDALLGKYSPLRQEQTRRTGGGVSPLAGHWKPTETLGPTINSPCTRGH